MTGLDRWLKQATRRLSDDSAAQVRVEIQQHYESTREAAINGGATADGADQLALTALGDANTANRQYRKVLLTSAEAWLLGKQNWGWSHRRVTSLLLLVLVVALLAVALWLDMLLFRSGAVEAALVLLSRSVLMGLAAGFSCIVPFLPVYTPKRSRICRYVRWVDLGVMPLVFLPGFFLPSFNLFWAFLAILYLWTWCVEWKRISIRRKLPVAQWPKHLYL